jgi:hypothetical protein
MSTLCEVCSAVFEEGSAELYGPNLSNSNGEDWHPFHPSVVSKVKWHPLHKSRLDYVKGLALGCELCSFITPIVPTNSTQLQTSFLISRKGDQLHSTQKIWIIDSSVSPRMPFKENAIVFAIKPMSSPSRITEVHDSAIAAVKSRYTGSIEAMHLASLWLQECTTRHERCTPLLEPVWYPTRLLQITGQTVRSIATAEQDMHGPYFTLSHRWGAVPPTLMLTPEFFESLRNGLDIASLEPTFRDALVATRSFGVQYMWIDLFCILQGHDVQSQQDWTKESVTMDRVYAGSLLNISAACTHAGTAGCFKQKSTLHEHPSLVRAWARCHGDHPGFFELVGDLPKHLRDDELLSFYSTSPIFRRGWIVQERILAPRVLHFADQGMIWECCEGVGTGLRPRIQNRVATSYPPPLPGALAFSGNSRSDLIRIWHRALNSYSRSELTMPHKDKLVALQGISKRVAELLQDTLFFGFLSCRMPYALCWRPRGYTSMSPPGDLENDTFPSWYFARSNEEITNGDDICEKSSSGYRYERPLLCHFPSPDLDPTLSVVPKYLCCITRIVSVVAESGLDQSQRIGMRLDSFTQDSDGHVSISSRNAINDSLEGFNLVFDHAYLKPDYDKRTWTVLPISIYSRTTSEIRGCSGLILQQTADGDFVRKGTFRCYSHSCSLTPPSDLQVLLDALKMAAPRFVMIA